MPDSGDSNGVIAKISLGGIEKAMAEAERGKTEAEKRKLFVDAMMRQMFPAPPAPEDR